ncbi:hypothetical protein Syun_002914 [Stephania yunnanensis]|uniref:Uncharacterized protein n=1 Tax=Stephania yunnanensis TaxID=152371 RepID=A0AAP0L065_9MAGN
MSARKRVPPRSAVTSRDRKAMKKKSYKGNFNGGGDLGKLVFLGLKGNNFESEVPSSFSNFSRLEELDMSSNRFVGPLPSLKASCMTTARIDLSSNKFSGQIPSSYANNDLPNLTYLDLSNNQLNGTIPVSLFTLPSLEVMILSKNKFIGILDDEVFPNSISSPLTTLDLSYNLLEENIPKLISKFTSLEYLDLNSNNFHGAVDPRMFKSLKNLSMIDLSDNIMLLIDTSDLAITIPSLSEFAASSCNLHAVPEFLRYQPNLYSLDLSNNQIQGKMPDWLWNNLEYVNLFNNSLVGFEDPFSNHSSSSLKILDLSSNNFQSLLPNFPKGMHAISLSKNKITGAKTICNSSCRRIDLSHNQISGEIPSCLFNSFFHISVVDLSKNKLQGIIPDTFGSECWLQGLNLNGNQLEGQLPRSLVNCRILSVLDLGNNQIDDTFPFWLEHLESLQVLMLQSNKFHGPIRRRHIANSSFESLHIISLSANSFTGHLPLEYFSSSYLKVGVNLIPSQAYSFEGNSRLCGIRLQIECNPNKSGNVAPPSDNANQSNGTNFDWIFAVAGYGSGLVVGVVIEHFVLWRNRYYLEKFMNTIRFFQDP